MTKRPLYTLVGAFAGPAIAATPLESLEELFGSEETVTIATGRVQSARTAPAVATVITAEDIRNGGFRSVAEALRLVPGIHLGLTTTFATNLGVRGFSSLGSSHVLMLLDGVAQSDLAMGNHLGVLGTIPLDVIDRIEVTRGPGSSVFGADAFSAVVNVITRDAARNAMVTLSGGTEGTASGRVLLGERVGATDLVLSAEATTTDGDAPTIGADQLSRIDALLGSHLSLAPSEVDTARRNSGVLFKATAGSTRGMLRLSRWNEDGLGAGWLGAIDPTGSSGLERVEGRLEHDLELTDRLTATLQLDAVRTDLVLDDLTWLSPFTLFPHGLRLDASAEQEQLKLRGDVRYAAASQHFITAGWGEPSSIFKGAISATVPGWRRIRARRLQSMGSWICWSGTL